MMMGPGPAVNQLPTPRATLKVSNIPSFVTGDDFSRLMLQLEGCVDARLLGRWAANARFNSKIHMVGCMESGQRGFILTSVLCPAQSHIGPSVLFFLSSRLKIEIIKNTLIKNFIKSLAALQTNPAGSPAATRWATASSPTR